MGNKTRPNDKDRATRPQPIGDVGEGGDVAVEEEPAQSWTVHLEDTTPAAQYLRPAAAVRGEIDRPRCRVYATDNLIGFVPSGDSAAIRAVANPNRGVLLGRVVGIDLDRAEVVVELRLEGR